MTSFLTPLMEKVIETPTLTSVSKQHILNDTNCMIDIILQSILGIVGLKL